MPKVLRRFLEWMLLGGLSLAVLALASLASLTAVAALPPGSASEPVSAQRALALRHLLIQDCGSCHGLRLAGGLGPSLQPRSLGDKPVEFLTYTILNGRPGTAMPPWAALLSESEALWLAREIKGQNP
ncbi:MAG: cytochrome oxidase, cbb3-type, subunit family protein [Chromatiaceae bacterium]|jgi:cytochrome c55X|nr:cytochrome oxidase, cbb3-type, subunit family protein [Chromatiaceae bacterium]